MAKAAISVRALGMADSEQAGCPSSSDGFIAPLDLRSAQTKVCCSGRGGFLSDFFYFKCENNKKITRA
jgi:hypothetical protein